MELCLPKNLGILLWKSDTNLTIDEKLAGIVGVASGIAHLHSMGMVHRDVKPSNIMIAADVWKLGDFGLSDVRSTMASKTTLKGGSGSGTQGYMSPELYKGTGGRSCDVYAFGVFFFEVATQTCCFDGWEMQRVFVAVTDTENVRSVSPKDFKDGFKDHQQESADLVNSCWSHDPNSRPKMLDVLRAITTIVTPPNSLPSSFAQLALLWRVLRGRGAF
jgi:serine/threonine protein kinase